MKRLLLCFIAFPCFAADVKPTFTVEQAQTVINLANAEMERACMKGNCLSVEPVLGIVKAIVRAAQMPDVPPPVVAPPVEAAKPAAAPKAEDLKVEELPGDSVRITPKAEEPKASEVPAVEVPKITPPDEAKAPQ